MGAPSVWRQKGKLKTRPPSSIQPPLTIVLLSCGKCHLLCLCLPGDQKERPKKDAGNHSLGSFLTWENVPLGAPMYPTPPHTFVLLVLATLHTSRLLCFVVFWQFSLCICFFNWPGLPFWEASTEILEHTSITEHCTGFPTIIVIVIVIVYQYATKCVKEEAEKWNLRTFTFSQS